MRTLLAFVLLMLSSCLPTCGQSANSNSAAPLLSFQELLQAPTGSSVSWNSLRGKVVVLEFWATWCGPCVANIPHLNELADKFAGKVRFIAIDDESTVTVKRFLVTHPMHAWIGMDQTQGTFRTYHVLSRPTTVVIDGNGRIVKTGVPEDVTPQLLSAVLEGAKRTEPAQPAQMIASVVSPGKIVSRMNLSITEAADNLHFLMASDNGTVQARSATPVQILSLLYGANITDIVLETQLPERPLDIQVDAPGVLEGVLLKTVQSAFASTLHIEPHWENRERDVYVLRASVSAHDKLPVSANAHSGYMMLQGTKLEDMKVAMPQFAAQLGSILKTPVVDSTGLDGRYDIAFALSTMSEEAVMNQIAVFGLSLEHERRVIRSLVVSSP